MAVYASISDCHPESRSQFEDMPGDQLDCTCVPALVAEMQRAPYACLLCHWSLFPPLPSGLFPLRSLLAMFLPTRIPCPSCFVEAPLSHMSMPWQLASMIPDSCQVHSSQHHRVIIA